MKNKIIVTGISLLVGVVSAASFVWLGVFDISATEKHWPITTRLLEMVRERSINARSADITAPDLENPAMIARGAGNYAAMCAQCHLAPGLEPTELNRGLYPGPPVFHRPDYAREPTEIFWIVKNGFKMTGMPAWGAFHSDKEIWELVSVVSALKGISPEQYRQLAGDGRHRHGDVEEGDGAERAHGHMESGHMESNHAH